MHNQMRLHMSNSNPLIHSVYKPPNEQFLLHPLRSRNMSQIAIGDFNSHNTLCGYTSTNNDGEAVDLWAESNNISLIHNSNLKSYRKGTTWTSYFHRQTFQICVRSMFSIQSPTLCVSNRCTTYHIQPEESGLGSIFSGP